MKTQTELNQQIGIIGLGYVGLTLAIEMADVGYQVIGIDKRQSIVDLTNDGVSNISENGLRVALRNVISNGKLKAYTKFPNENPCKVYIITIGTPLNGDGQVNHEVIQDTTYEVAQHMTDDALVILRSAVKTGSTCNIVASILDASDKRYSLAFCTEPTLEGIGLQELSEII